VTNTRHTTGPATRPDPEKADPNRDQPGKPTPERIAEILLLAQILAAYGRHLAAVIQYRGLWRGFATVAQFFGTAAIADIAVRLRRGIMRAVALERVLLQRARRGRDLKILAPRDRANRPSRADEEPTTIFTLWSPGPLPEE
jgi:hypothetical protein